jgi:hypothetical protein
MATRGIVAIKREDSVEAIYNHFDSSPRDLGKTLVESYPSLNLVNWLIGQGDSRYIESDPAKCEFYRIIEKDPSIMAKAFGSVGEMNDWVQGTMVDYVYLFDAASSKWSFSKFDYCEFQDLATYLSN